MGGTRAVIGAQHRARVHPYGADALRVQELSAQRGGQQFSHRHDPRAFSIADGAALCQRADQLAQLQHEGIELCVRNYT